MTGIFSTFNVSPKGPRCLTPRRHCGWLVERLECRSLLSGGQLDPTFGTGGIASGEFWPDQQTTAVAVQQDGKILVAGVGYTYPQAMPSYLSRFTSGGAVDRSFGNQGRVNINLSGSYQTFCAVAQEKNGRILALVRADNGNRLYCFNSQGMPDLKFGSGGVIPLSTVGNSGALALQQDGDIVVLGPTAGGFGLTRFTADGKVDGTFGMGGSVITPANVKLLAIQPNGDILAAGGDYGITVARYRHNGTLDPSFGAGGIAHPASDEIDGIASIALQPDGKIVVGCAIGPYGQLGDVARLTSRGNLDRTFGHNGIAGLSPALTSPDAPPVYGYTPRQFDAYNIVVMVQADGSIAVGGNYSYSDGEYSNTSYSYFSVAHLSRDGALDKSYANAGVRRDDLDRPAAIERAAVMQADGKVILAGNSTGDLAVARYTRTGAFDDSFGFHGAVIDANGISGTINAVATRKDGKVIIAGFEVSPDPSKPQAAALARYNADGSLDTRFGVDGRVIAQFGNAAAYSALLIDSNGDILAGGYGSVAGVREFAISRYLPDGAIDKSFGSSGTVFTSLGDPSGQACTSLLMQANGDILAVGSTSGVGSAFAPDPAVAVARYLPNGTLDPHFGTGGKFLFHNPLHRGITTSGAVLQPDGKIVIGATVNLMRSNFAVIRIGRDGTLDPSFGTGGFTFTDFSGGANDPHDVVAHAIGIDSRGGIILGGSFDYSDFALVRYLPSGVLDPAFGSRGLLKYKFPLDGGDEIDSLVIQRDDKIVIGGISQGNDDEPLTGSATARPDLGTYTPDYTTFARFTSKGLDSTFGDDGFITAGYDNPVTTLVIDRSGRIVGAAGSDIIRLTHG